jgi:hypothetical protein
VLPNTIYISSFVGFYQDKPSLVLNIPGIATGPRSKLLELDPADSLLARHYFPVMNVMLVENPMVTHISRISVVEIPISLLLANYHVLNLT